MGASIYIVDDDQAVRDSVQTLLETYGYEVHGFPSGEAFLDGYDGRPACLLLDINMPGMNGPDVLRRVGRRWAELPVIMISGRSERTNASDLIAEGAADFLPKPFADTAVVAAIERALKRSPDRR